MNRKANNPVQSTLLIAAGIAGIVIVTALVLRILMAPLYEEAAMADRRGSHSESARSSRGGTDVNVDLAGLPWLLNWAIGWAWGGPGWHNNGWGWNNWGGWNGGGHGWNGNVNNTVNRTFNDINRGGANNLERNVERGVERSGGGNIGRQIERAGGGNIERNVEHGGGRR